MDPLENTDDYSYFESCRRHPPPRLWNILFLTLLFCRRRKIFSHVISKKKKKSNLKICSVFLFMFCGGLWLCLSCTSPLLTSLLQCRPWLCPLHQPQPFPSSWARRGRETLAPLTQIYYWYRQLNELCMFFIF